VGSAALRPLRDLFIDRRNLHTVPGADEKRSGFDRPWRRRMVERRHRHGSEARTPGQFDRLAVVLCLLLGWSGVIAYDSLASALPSASLLLLAIGGFLYSVGALFHVWQGLRFHKAIWHGFVLIAASCHYSAVLACLPWA
jgi:hypothetical protein